MVRSFGRYHVAVTIDSLRYTAFRNVMDYSDDGLEVRHDLDLNVRKRPPDKLFHIGRSRDLSFFFWDNTWLASLLIARWSWLRATMRENGGLVVVLRSRLQYVKVVEKGYE